VTFVDIPKSPALKKSSGFFNL